MIVGRDDREAVECEVRRALRGEALSPRSALLLAVRHCRFDRESPVEATLLAEAATSRPAGCSAAFLVHVGELHRDGMSKAETLKEAVAAVVGELEGLPEMPVVLPPRPRTGPRSPLSPPNERFLMEVSARFGGNRAKALDEIVRAARLAAEGMPSSKATAGLA